MKYSQAIKPISYLRAHASEVIRDITEKQKTMIITQHGEAKVVVQDIHVFEQTQESLVMLKLLAQSKISLQQGKVKLAAKAFMDLAERVRAGKVDV